jgi:hypothetical protein
MSVWNVLLVVLKCPTAHTLLVEAAATPSSSLFRPGTLGLGTIFQVVAPVRRSTNVCSGGVTVFEFALPTAYTLSSELAATALRTLFDNCVLPLF